ncbi:hypothetical protein AA0323_2700 [Asaia siamensis NRIC 0323]|nr:hypothetical protein AA0323_2700 [Asaia siamensis NRIC 0323]
MAVMSPTTQSAWPLLREDLQLLPGQPENGHPTWILYDPVAHRYIKLPWYDIEALNRWHLADASRIADAMRSETAIRVSPDDIERLRKFLIGARLTLPNTADHTRQFVEILARKRSNPVKWLIHHYLFISVTLCNPDALLGRWEARLRFMTGRRVWLIIAGLGISALCVITQQWDMFVHDIGDLWSWRGFALVGCAYFLSKIMHEIGHGLAAKRLGCRVPSMGLALLVLCPVLWTNTTNAWRLTSPRARIAIDIAGMTAELFLGSLAAWLWIVLPDGTAREAALALAASSWVMALTVNLNPLMRFDGYYIFSDLIGTENLQERAFAYSRWILRRAVFGDVTADREPGELPTHKKPLVACWAFSTWIYRFFLFFGIALLVYHATFEALGLVLMAIEIGVFIIMPIMREAHIWARSFTQAPHHGRARFLGLCMLLLLALFLPLPSAIHLPAVMEALEETELTSREHGTIAYVGTEGMPVAKGEPILVLHDDAIARDIVHARAELRYWSDITTQLMRNSVGLQSLNDSIAHKAAALAALEKANEREASLTLRAPFSGVLRDVSDSIRKGNLIARHQKIAVLVAPGKSRITAYATQRQLDYIQKGEGASFVPYDQDRKTSSSIQIVHDFPEESIKKAVLWDAGRGAIKAKNIVGNIKPDRALYRVESISIGEFARKIQSPGVLVIDGKSIYLSVYLYNAIVSSVMDIFLD